MNENVKREIDDIVKVIADTGMITKIILFGSHARGEETPESDVDLCVLTPIKDRHPADISVDLRMKLYGLPKPPLDLITYNQDEFLKHSKRKTSFEHEIAEHGMVLYECV